MCDIVIKDLKSLKEERERVILEIKKISLDRDSIYYTDKKNRQFLFDRLATLDEARDSCYITKYSWIISSVKVDQRKEVEDVNLEKPPATFLNGIIEFVYSKKSKERIFDCILADMYDELYSALDEKKFHKARWIRVKTNLLLIQAMLDQVPNAILKKAVDIFKPSGD